MAHYYEVRHWCNGVRTVEIFETQKQADKHAASIRDRCGWPIPVSINDVTSTWNPIKWFRELRKRTPAPRPELQQPEREGGTR